MVILLIPLLGLATFVAATSEIDEAAFTPANVIQSDVAVC